VNRKGERFEPYIRLGLWHHHLSRAGDPLLVLQKIGDDVYAIALTCHADYFDGDKAMWLMEHMEGIDWSGCEDIKDAVEAYVYKGCQPPW
jgi:hypothetical protein